MNMKDYHFIYIIDFLSISTKVIFSRSMNIPDDYIWQTSDCTKDYFNGRLARFCRKHQREMIFFPTAVAATKYYCKEEFRFRRWDCTSIDKKPHGVDLREGK